MLTGRTGGSSSSFALPSGSMPTLVSAKSGMYFETGSVRASLPSSISIIAPRHVIGLVIEWIEKIVSGVIARPVLVSRTPMLFKYTGLPCCCTMSTAPASRPVVTSLLK